MNKSHTPKRKRLTRKARLSSAISWIKKYDGRNIISGYAKWYGVDKISAINELKTLGVSIHLDLEKQIVESHKSRIEQKRIIREKRKNIETFIQSSDSDENFAFIAGYTSGGFPYGITHEEFTRIEKENTD